MLSQYLGVGRNETEFQATPEVTLSVPPADKHRHMLVNECVTMFKIGQCAYNILKRVPTHHFEHARAMAKPGPRSAKPYTAYISFQKAATASTNYC